MLRLVLYSCILYAPLLVQAGELDDVVQGVELRYNRLATMQADFEQKMIYGGRTRMVERGRLALKRPGKMRWDYSKPEGKLAVGEGELMRLYNPRTNQARTVRFGDEADMRAPLAFLLGRLRIKRQFKNVRLETIDNRRALVGEGRTGGEAYGKVEFIYEPDFRLSEIRAYGRDESVSIFLFRNEVRNQSLDDALFVFQAPPGAEVLEPVDLGAPQ